MYRKTYIEVDLDSLGKNVKNIVKTFSGYDYYIGVIKGNAYGHGDYIAKYIIDNGINYLAVSSLEEGVHVRKYVSNIPILCLEPIDLEFIADVIKYNITLCVSSMEYFKKLKNLSFDGKINFHLKLNTGMNRLGVSEKDVVTDIYEEAFKCDNVCLEGIFTHLATSGVYDTLYKRQIDKFKELTSDIDLSRIKIVHVGRSCTLDFFPKLSFCNGVRIGIMMYGVESTFPLYRKGLLGKIQYLKRQYFYKNNNILVPYSERKINLIQSLSLKSEVIEIQKVSKGSNVGYGSSYRVESDCYIAVLPVGYADGIGTNYHDFIVSINEREYEVVGSINMGMITVLVDDKVSVGDVVTIFDSKKSYKRIARNFNVSPYVFLTNLRREIPRVYYKDGKIDRVVEYEE